MKVMKKLAAFVAIIAMVATMALPAFATEGVNTFQVTTDNNKVITNAAESTTITGLSNTTTGMTAYQIIYGTFENNAITYHLKDWAKTSLVGEGDGQYPDEAAALAALGVTSKAEIDANGNTTADLDFSQAKRPALTKLYKDAPTSGGDGITASRANNQATFASLPVGGYVVVATDSVNTYNPMGIAVNVVVENHQYTGVAANGTVAKYEKIVTEKDITNGDTVKENLSSASVGDTLEFTLKINNVPKYPANATNKTLYMADTISKGLTKLDGTFVLHYGSNTIKIDENGAFSNVANLHSEVADANGNVTFAIIFDYDKLDALLGDGSREITITYDATLNQNAVIAGPNPNTYQLAYATNPSDGTTYVPGQDKPIKPTEGHDEITWSDETKREVYTYGLAIKKVDEEKKTGSHLIGAEFGVYTDPACNDDSKIGTVLIDDESSIGKLAGIEAGTYYIKETKAPAGYNLSDAVVKVVVNAETSQIYSKFEETTVKSGTWTEDSEEVFMSADQVTDWETKNGTVLNVQGNTTGTTVKLNGPEAGKTYYRDAQGQIFEAQDEGNTRTPVQKYTVTTTYTTQLQTKNSSTTVAEGYDFEAHAIAVIQDLKGSVLPSTGGMGTTLFYVIGGLLIVAAAIVIISKRRVQEG